MKNSLVLWLGFVGVCGLAACTSLNHAADDAGTDGNLPGAAGGSTGAGGAAGSAGKTGAGGFAGGTADAGGVSDAGTGGVTGAGGMTGGAGGAPAPALLAIAPTSKDLSLVVIGLYAEATFEISNNGGVATSLPMVTLDGADAAQFMISNNACAAAIAPGKSCLVTVRFVPNSPGLKMARLNVQATLGGAVAAALQGSGITPGALTIDPANQSFGSVTQGQRGTPVAFTVINTGGETSGALATMVSASTELSITTDGCKGMTLAPSARCTITVTFAPTSGDRRAGRCR